MRPNSAGNILMIGNSLAGNSYVAQRPMSKKGAGSSSRDRVPYYSLHIDIAHNILISVNTSGTVNRMVLVLRGPSAETR